MIDAGFPIIRFSAEEPPKQRGERHGEQFAAAISELVQIRRGLMKEKNPGLTPQLITDLAAEQMAATETFDPQLADELRGIATGARLPLEDVVVLNNYTDFRDIHVPDQGCSTIFINRQSPLAGQTWDMHGSAKNYVCCIEIDASDPSERQILFSLVGCVGLMGYNGRGLMIGVNNINTDGAVPGVIWPALVRTVLKQTTLDRMLEVLTSAPVTSGHAYLVASPQQGDFWEVLPGLSERVSSIKLPDRGHLFHTNHCLGTRAKKREITAALSSTTAVRYGLLEKKIGDVDSFQQAVDLLNDHENYPMSICSAYQSGSQDPSVTCGGAMGQLDTGAVCMWRGDPVHDKNFVKREFELGAVRVG